MSVRPDIGAAAAMLRARMSDAPEAVLVLGSGLGDLADEVVDAQSVPFSELPGFPPPGVQGHRGRYLIGRLGGVSVLVQAGRYHVYEGHDMDVIAAPVRLAAALAVPRLFLTNASGAVNPGFEPGDAVLIEDHINLMFRSPLSGPVHPGEERFPDMSSPYDPELASKALDAAGQASIELHRGVYAAVTGPSYETAAEIRMLGRLGADLVGMSTVPEAIVAAASGIRCLALSMVTNKGTGLSDTTLTHQEVVEVGASAGRRVGLILKGVLSRLAAGQSTGAK